MRAWIADGGGFQMEDKRWRREDKEFEMEDRLAVDVEEMLEDRRGQGVRDKG